MAPHSSTLAWKIPWTEEPGRLQFMGSLRVRHDWTTHFSLSCTGEGHGNPLQCSCLEHPKDRGAWWAAIYGVAQSRTRLKWPGSSSSRKPYALVTGSVQFSSVAQSCPTLCDPMNRSIPGLPVHHKLPEFTQTHLHWVGDAIQPCHPLSSPSPPAPNPSQHQSLFQWVNSSHEVAKILEFQLQHHSLQRNPRLISFRMDWLDLLAVQGTLKSLLQYHSSKASILQLSALFTVQLSHPYILMGRGSLNSDWKPISAIRKVRPMWPHKTLKYHE